MNHMTQVTLWYRKWVGWNRTPEKRIGVSKQSDDVIFQDVRNIYLLTFRKKISYHHRTFTSRIQITFPVYGVSLCD